MSYAFHATKNVIDVCSYTQKKNFTDSGMKIENIKARCASIGFMLQITLSTKTPLWTGHVNVGLPDVQGNRSHGRQRDDKHTDR